MKLNFKCLTWSKAQNFEQSQTLFKSFVCNCGAESWKDQYWKCFYEALSKFEFEAWAKVCFMLQNFHL